MSSEIVDRDMDISPLKEFLYHLMCEVEIECIWMIEIVIMGIIMILLRQSLVEGVQRYVTAVQMYSLSDSIT